MYTCPVCFYDGLAEEPKDYNICDCCGTEFGSDDSETAHSDLRAAWIAAGAQWFFGVAPFGWIPWVQLIRANVGPLPYSGVVIVGGDQYSVTHLEVGEVDLPPCYQPCGSDLALAA